MDKGVIQRLKESARGQFLAGEPLGRHCSFRIGGPAGVFFVPAGREDFLSAWKALHASRVPSTVLGNGTNVLFGDAGFDGAVIRLKSGFDHVKVLGAESERKSSVASSAGVWSESGERRRPARPSTGSRLVDVAGDLGRDPVPGRAGRRLVEESGPFSESQSSIAIVEIGAGATLPGLHIFASRKGFIGTEFTFGIPGTVGGAILCNAGTRLGDMASIVSEIEVCDGDGKARWIPASEARFGYRSCGLPAGLAVLSARVKLVAGGSEVATTDVRELKAYRKKCQPLGHPSAGSVFKNPDGDFAGRLIDAAGLKGLRLGDAEVSPVHANFITNRGKATAAQVRRLMEIVRAEVERTQGVRLDPEIRLLGDFGKEERC